MRRNAWAALVAAAGASPAMAGGYLWISAEFSSPFGTPPKIWRYNVGTGLVDYSIKPTFGGNDLDPNADVYNNLASDGVNLYVGTDDADVFAVADRITGVCNSNPGYQPPPSGSWEDGSYNKSNGHLYRMGTSFLETDTSGNVLFNRTINGLGFSLGSEWIGSTMYSTDLGTTFGEVQIIDANTAQFVNTSGIAGIPGTHIYEALALDEDTNILYMTTTDIGGTGNVWLWEVDPIARTASNGVDLSGLGYPQAGVNGAGGYILADGMGWVKTVPTPGSAGLLGLAALGAGRRRRSV
jgi:MYXO-CTERM domain-containing protein